MAKKLIKPNLKSKSTYEEQLMVLVENLGDQIKLVAEGNLMLGERMDRGFEEVGKRFDSMENRMDSMEQKMGSMENRMDSMEGKIDSLEKRMGSMENRMDSMEQKMGSMENRMDSMEGKIDSLEKRMGSMENRMDSMEGKIDSLEKDMHSSFKTVIECLSRIEDEIAEIKIELKRLEEKKADKEVLIVFGKRLAKIERELEEHKNLCKNR